jgi:hypothetical protein
MPLGAQLSAALQAAAGTAGRPRRSSPPARAGGRKAAAVGPEGRRRTRARRCGRRQRAPWPRIAPACLEASATTGPATTAAITSILWNHILPRNNTPSSPRHPPLGSSSYPVKLCRYAQVPRGRQEQHEGDSGRRRRAAIGSVRQGSRADHARGSFCRLETERPLRYCLFCFVFVR